MTPPPPETLNPHPTEPWTLVTRRRRRKALPNPPPRSQTQTLTLTLTESKPPSSPWTPTDTSTDPERQSKLLRRIQSSILQFQNSQFSRRFLSRLHHPQIQLPLHKLLSSSSPHIQIVFYGIGSIESYNAPRLQLALALLLKQELGAIAAAQPIQVFDPVLSAVECAVLAALGCRVVAVDECGRRETDAPTIYYMPHCEAGLYDNLLDANWKPEMLRRMVVVGNSFGVYARCAGGMRGGCGSVDLEAEGRRLLGVRRYVREVGMEEGEEGEEEEDEFYKAFHDISWHFFELGDDDDLELFLCK